MSHDTPTLEKGLLSGTIAVVKRTLTVTIFSMIAHTVPFTQNAVFGTL